MIYFDKLAQSRQIKLAETLGVYGLGLLAVWVTLVTRFYLLRTMPGWFTDEGSDMDIAIHLMQGQVRYLALGQSVLVTGRLPLFHLVLAGLFRLFGPDILILRALTATYGAVITLLLVVLGRDIWGNRVAVAAAFMYALYPSAVLNNRLGFMYNQVALLYLLLFYSLWRFTRTGQNRWLAGACLMLSLALVTTIAPLPLIGFVVLAIFLTRRSALVWAGPLILLLPALYAGWMLSQAPAVFLADLGALTDRVGGSSLVKVFLAVWNYKRLLLWDAWIPVAAIGLTRLQPGQNRLYTQSFFWYNLFFTITGVSQVVSLGFHYVIPLLPWVAVGMAALLVWALPRLLHEVENAYDLFYARLGLTNLPASWGRYLYYAGRVSGVSLLTLWMLFAPFIGMAVQTWVFPEELLFPELEQVMVGNTVEAMTVVDYINGRVEASDVVLAPPHVAWLIKAQVADFQQAAAYLGGTTWNYAHGLPRERFLFDCSPANSRYALIWSGWRRWEGDRMPDVDNVSRLIEQNWPVVYEVGAWRVYANPERQGQDGN